MAVLVVRLNGEQYVTWSRTLDAPVSCVMTRDELVHHLEAQERVPFEQAVHLVELADATGSSDPSLDVTSLLANNRAGANESCLAVEEIVRLYGQPD